MSVKHSIGLFVGLTFTALCVPMNNFIKAFLILGMVATLVFIVIKILICDARFKAEKKIREIKKFTGEFKYPLVPLRNGPDGWDIGIGFQMNGFTVHVWIDTDYRDDGTYNYNTCHLKGINSWSGIDLPLGTDLTNIYVETTSLIRDLESRGLKTTWGYVERDWNKLVKHINPIKSCVRKSEATKQN